MYDLAHVCTTCRTMTIFAKDAPYPRRCACCDELLRAAPSEGKFVARPVWDDEDEDERFTLELGPATMSQSPF